ncbi:MAG: DUF2914 domain-containing protein [Syntrophobacterales bacterium]|nr:MAG: DUF2914 domain-containing protein [Syntrophobacterales bacterium]
MTKTKRKPLILSAIAIVAFLGPPLGQIGKLSAEQKLELPAIQNAVICERVDDRTPRGIRQTYPSTIGTIYCFTHLAKIPSEGIIYHVWYYGNVEIARVELSISPPQWRTWSSKKILPERKGNWKVEVVYGDHILKTLTFAIE